MNAATGGFLVNRNGCRRVFDYSEPLFFRSKIIPEYRNLVVCQPLCQFFCLCKHWRHRRTFGGRFVHLKVIANTLHQIPHLWFKRGNKLPLPSPYHRAIQHATGDRAASYLGSGEQETAEAVSRHLRSRSGRLGRGGDAIPAMQRRQQQLKLSRDRGSAFVRRRRSSLYSDAGASRRFFANLAVSSPFLLSQP